MNQQWDSAVSEPSQDVDVSEVSDGDEDVFVLDEAPDPDSVLPVWEPTGNATVDAALERLHDLSGADLGEHAAILEGVEATLRQALDGLTAEDDSA